MPRILFRCGAYLLSAGPLLNSSIAASRRLGNGVIIARALLFCSTLLVFKNRITAGTKRMIWR